jgi:hypothetical protein
MTDGLRATWAVVLWPRADFIVLNFTHGHSAKPCPLWAIHSMAIEIFIKLLTIIGSILGSVAFFQNMSKDVVATNKEKWKALTLIIHPSDFDDYAFGILRRKINGKTFERVERFFLLIDKRDQEYLGFKSLFKNHFQHKISRISALREELRKYIQVPYWSPYRDDGDTIGYEFDKEVFFEKAIASGKDEDYNEASFSYAKHLDEAQKVVLDMQRTFIEIQRMANRDSFEIILPWKWTFR